MFVLGIDPGLTATGFGLVRSSGQAVAAGIIRTDPSAPIGARLSELYDDLRAIIEEHRPDVAAIEQVFVNRNRQTATAVGRAAGVAILAAAQTGLDVFEYSPTTVKKAVSGFGSAPKEQMQRMVMRRLNLREVPNPPDAADALAVAICHLQAAGLARSVAR